MTGRCQDSKGPETKVCGLTLGDSNGVREQKGNSLEMVLYEDSHQQPSLSTISLYLLLLHTGVDLHNRRYFFPGKILGSSNCFAKEAILAI